MNWLTEEHVRRNTAARDDWESAGPHRQRVTAELVRGFPPLTETLCVLGAGNCNDLDLPRLLDVFREVHLVDLDSAALEAGIDRQGVSDHPAVRLHGGVEVTGIWDRLADYSPDAPPDDETLTALAADAWSFAGPALPGPFGMVASHCLLSQLVEAVVRTVGEGHPRFLEILDTVRGRHLRLLAELTRPGGYGLMVTDIVSSETAPELQTLSDKALPDALKRMIEARNFFHGLNPFVLATLYQDDPRIAPEIQASQLLRPWRWHACGRIYAVTGIKFQRRD
jgi:hypothetical protein